MRRTSFLLTAIVVPRLIGRGALTARRRRLLRSRPSWRRPSDDLLGAERRDRILSVAQFGQHLLGVLAQQRRANHVGRAVGELDRVAYAQVLAALRVIDLDHRAGL